MGGGNRGERRPWSLLNLRTLHRIVIFEIGNLFSLVKWPPLLLVASSASKYSNLRCTVEQLMYMVISAGYYSMGACTTSDEVLHVKIALATESYTTHRCNVAKLPYF